MVLPNTLLKLDHAVRGRSAPAAVRATTTTIDIRASIWYSYVGKEIDMDAVTVSPKYQVVIPKAVRERTGIKPGEKLQVLSFDDRIELVRTQPMRKMRGFLRGLDPTFVRDEDDRA